MAMSIIGLAITLVTVFILLIGLILGKETYKSQSVTILLVYSILLLASAIVIFVPYLMMAKVRGDIKKNDQSATDWKYTNKKGGKMHSSEP